MNILGVYFGHDANLALLQDGKIKVAIEKERITRLKHAAGFFTKEQIEELIGMDLKSVDIIATNPFVAPNEAGMMYRWQVEDSDTLVYTRDPEYIKSRLVCAPARRYSAHRINFFGRMHDAYFIDHHLAHIAGAAFSSPFSSGTVLSWDGGGDERNCARADFNNNKLGNIEYGWNHEREYPTEKLNIGSTWASLGQLHFNMQRLEAAGKLMALAAYGKPKDQYVNLFDRQAHAFEYSPFPAYLFGEQLMKWDDHDREKQNIVSSLQSYTETILLEACSGIDNQNLCITGGCALNCVANRKLWDMSQNLDIFVPPYPHDGGLAIGMVLAVWYHILGESRTPEVISPYLGTDAGLEPSQESLLAAVEELAKGKTVAVCYGKEESGPRALGHRSILLDPRMPDGKKRLNEIKQREWYRPFAPIVLDDGARRPRCDFMSFTEKNDGNKYPSIDHVDGTTRPQYVKRENQDWIVRLLLEWEKKTGCDRLVNTSFNIREPLVSTVQDAIATWRSSNIDCLVTPDRLMRSKNLTDIKEAKPKLLIFDPIGTFIDSYIQGLRGSYNISVATGLFSTWKQEAQKYDVVWCDWANELAIEVSKSLPPGPRLFIRLHAYEYETGLFSHIEWDRISKLILVSEHYGNLVKASLPEKMQSKCEIVHTGIDLESIEGQEVSNTSRDPKGVAVVAREEMKKGISLLPIVAAEFPRYNFSILGAQSERKVKSLLDHYELKNIIRYGHLDRKTYLGELKRNSYVLSLSPSESFGVGIGEGMACGCHPLIFDYPGARELWPERALWRDIGKLRVLLEDAREETRKENIEWTKKYDIKKSIERMREIFST